MYKAEYWVTLDERKVSSKPDDRHKRTITGHLTLKRCFTIPEFARYVTQPYGYTWSGGLFNGTRSNTSWTSQQVFGLDFDRGTIPAEEVIEIISQFGFKPQLYYTTFSDSLALRKFRMVFFLESPITDIRLHKMVHTSLMSMFPDVDKSCHDASRYFYGGKEYTLVNTSPISTSQFLDALSIQLCTCDSGKLRSLPLNADYYKNPVQKRTFYYYYYYNVRFQTDSDTTMTYQKVEYNGYKFMMKCYDNEALRSIQLSLIESDLVQAVGRARTLRTNATVEVYSSFPLSISDEFVY